MTNKVLAADRVNAMKHQYFGDINDYRKYGLLLGLSGRGVLRTGVCWMLTGPDGRSDGAAVSYLEDRQSFRHLAPDLFDFLYECIHIRLKRHTTLLEASGYLPSTRFFSRPMADDECARKAYFAKMLRHFTGVDLVFFDPDNGFEISSRPIGRTGASKYLYWTELCRTYEAGHSVLVYQHFPRENRPIFIRRIASKLIEQTGTDGVFSFRTPRVVFFLAAQQRHLEHFSVCAEAVAERWGVRHIAFQKHDYRG
jgi:hypothetical protein